MGKAKDIDWHQNYQQLKRWMEKQKVGTTKSLYLLDGTLGLVHLLKAGSQVGINGEEPSREDGVWMWV